MLKNIGLALMVVPSRCMSVCTYDGNVLKDGYTLTEPVTCSAIGRRQDYLFQPRSTCAMVDICLPLGVVPSGIVSGCPNDGMVSRYENASAKRISQGTIGSGEDGLFGPSAARAVEDIGLPRGVPSGNVILGSDNNIVSRNRYDSDKKIIDGSIRRS